jgi:hypothetical protein
MGLKRMSMMRFVVQGYQFKFMMQKVGVFQNQLLGVQDAKLLWH